jgi:hypothetical protein
MLLPLELCNLLIKNALSDDLVTTSLSETLAAISLTLITVWLNAAPLLKGLRA